MSSSKFIGIALTTFVCATALAVDAGAQSRGGGSRGGSSGGVRGPAGGVRGPAGGVRGPAVGRAPLPAYRYPYYSYGYRPYYGYGYRGYYGYPGISLGFGFGYPYGYGYYGYGYPYYYGYPYAYGGYYPPAYVVPGSAAYGGVRIQGAPRNAEVYVDGNYAGVVDDYDGAFQRLDLEPGSHEIEIRGPGRPLTYDVNVTPGQTVTLHANVR
jgi:PEGA domain